MPSTRAPEGLARDARTRLAALGEKKPTTKAAQIRALWPHIKTALDNGHSLKSVCECLAADGIAVSVQSLGSYVTRIRRRSTASEGTMPPLRGEKLRPARGERPSAVVDPIEKKSRDPLANMREREKRRAGFDYRPELADPKELI
jgi:hypothetical protein